ncbi:MAG TPA: ABC transporter transmembrane domain-containing protein, partial [Asanoa sp.]|nr:ABC transporter transmembrane domain-containing protein [Asanoa sp.]
MNAWTMLRAERDRESISTHRLASGTWRRIMRFARPYRVDMTIFLITVVIGAAIGVATPILAGRVINTITGGASGAAAEVIRIAVLIGILAVADALLSLAQRWYSARIGEGIILDLRTRVYDHVQRMPLAF